MTKRKSTHSASPAFRFVLAMGVVNLFADTTYEGGAGINGQFLASLGAIALRDWVNDYRSQYDCTASASVTSPQVCRTEVNSASTVTEGRPLRGHSQGLK